MPHDTVHDSSSNSMDATTLSRWTRFALKGGIGHCTAKTDYLAESVDDLMFLKGDEITVLMQLDETSENGEEGRLGLYLGYCEGVVGRFQGEHVQFHAKLKKPVMAKRRSARNTTDSLSPTLSPRLSTSRSPALSLTAQSPSSNALTLSPPQSLPTLLPPAPHSELEDSPVLPIFPSPALPVEPSGSIDPDQPVNGSTLPVGADIARSLSQSTASSRYSLDSSRYSPASSPTRENQDQQSELSPDDDDENFGIGFALLQDDDEIDDIEQSRYSTETPIPSPSPELMTPATSAEKILSASPEPEEPQTNSSPHSSPPSPPEPPFFSSSPSERDSLKPSVHSTSDWESDMDIYDDYRYSRYSVASRMSRFSVMSTATRAMGTAEAQPPMPTRPSLDSRPSGESVRPILSKQSSLDSPVDLLPPSMSSSLNLRTTPPAPLDLSKKLNRAAGLSIVSPNGTSNFQPSPLLHTNWGSPETSPEAMSMKSPASAQFNFGFGFEEQGGGGIASAMRKRLEGDRTLDPVHKSRESLYQGRDIVIEDDDAPPPDASDPSMTFDSSFGTPDITIEGDTEPLSPSDATSPPPSPLGAVPPPSPHSAPSSFARTTLSDLRASVNPVTRTSIFLPHPNAPQANTLTANQGPKYVQPELPMPKMPDRRDGSLLHVLHLAVSGPPVDLIRGPTIYARLLEELSLSNGPVGISFTLTPILATAPPHANRGRTIPTIATPTPRRAATASVIPPSTPSTTEEPVPIPVSNDEPSSEPLPRANFFPKTSTRPRSRSFSGFDSGSSMPIPKPRSSEDLEKPPPSPSSLSSPTPPSPSRTPRGKGTSLRVTHAPSPLSLPHNNSVVGPAAAITSLRHVASSSVLEGRRTSSSLGKSPNPSGLSHLRHLSRASSSTSPTPTASLQESETRSVNSPSPHLMRNSSLRNKMSLPNLRRKESPTATMQVDDMDFELIPPTLPTINGRSSEDSKGSIIGRDSFNDLRAESPIGSVSSRSPTAIISSSSPLQGPSWPLATTSAEDIEAHRNRELRWMSLMTSIPASQSRKSKKVKKMVYEGVPSSVRSLVWGHLTDGKDKMVVGIYKQLAVRGKDAGKSDLAEKDLEGPLEAYTFMTDIVQGQVIELLRAYLTMVPDVTYRPGLSLVAAILLTMIPEEDAFWTFVSIMDANLRPYFSSHAIQMEVDSELFSRALEANDPQVFKKMYVELHINPMEVCAPWFESVFANALPVELLHRVWDFFLFEGVPFLFRVGIALVICCRRQIIEASTSAPDSVEKILKYLHRPPANWLPPSVDGFVSLAASAKVKEDDVRKLREKMVTQLQSRKGRAGGRVMSPIARR